MANGCISVERILSKLDEHLGRNDYAAAERHLCYWLSEAESGGDGGTELLVRNELMGLYRKTARKDEALASAEAALSAIRRMGIDEQVGAATTYLNSATVYKAFGMAEQSIPLFERARSIYERELDENDSRLGGLYNNMALSLIDLSRFSEAYELYSKAISVMEKAEGGALEVAAAGDIVPTLYTTSTGSVVDNALASNAQVVSAGLAVKESRLNYMKAKGSWFPTINLSGGIGTSYYTNFRSAAYPTFRTQLENNRGGYVGVSMSIPIFSNLSRKTSVRSSRNALRNAELEMDAVRNAVESEVVQACRQMEGYGKQYIQAVKKIEAAQLAYDGIAAKFDKGLVTAIELQMSATTLLQAKSDCLRSKLQYMIEKRMVDYYSGIPLVDVK